MRKIEAKNRLLNPKVKVNSGHLNIPEIGQFGVGTYPQGFGVGRYSVQLAIGMKFGASDRLDIF